MPFQAYDEHLLKNWLVTFLAADTTVWKALVYPAIPGGRIDSITLSNTDVIAHDVEFRMSQGGSYAYLGYVAVPAGAGTLGVPAVDGLAALQLGVPAAVLLDNGSGLEFRAVVAVTLTNEVAALAVGGEF